MRLSESLKVIQGPIGPHRDFDRGVIAVLFHEHLGGSVVFEVGGWLRNWRHIVLKKLDKLHHGDADMLV